MAGCVRISRYGRCQNNCCSLEVFVNDGEQAAVCCIYTPPEAKSISFARDGSVLMDVEKYDLEVE